MTGPACSRPTSPPGCCSARTSTIGDGRPDRRPGGDPRRGRIGAGARIGDHAQIRDGAVIGAGSTIGSFSSVDPGVIVGDRVSVQTRCYLTGGTVIEDDVFVGPGVTLTNDNTMDRHGPELEFEGPLLRRACRVGGGVVALPRGRDRRGGLRRRRRRGHQATSPRARSSSGVPARAVREVPDEDLLERWR